MPRRSPQQDSPLRRAFEAGRDLYYAATDAKDATQHRECINCHLPVPPALPGHARAVICLDCQEKARMLGVGVAGRLFTTILDSITRSR